MRAYEYFLNYIKIDSRSDENSGKTPSSPGQLDVARAVEADLKRLGVSDVKVDDFGYVYAVLPATLGRESEKIMGLIAHMDTAPVFPGKNINPSVIEKYDGSDITLNAEQNIVMDRKTFPSLEKHIGQTLIVTDGTTLLGSDDKAGIAEIIAATESVIKDNLSHPEIKIAFTPDEEIGEGAEHFDVEGFGADYAFTVDGGAIGELEYENFNAAGATVTVHGNCIHPGEGKNRMKNSVLIAMEFAGMLPPEQTPAHTEGYEGFYHLTDMEGKEEQTVIKYIIRDHDKTNFENRKQTMERIASYLNEKYGKNTVVVDIKDSYYNMREKILPHMDIIDKAKKAFTDNGVEPEVVPVRGGTDGARISYMGLPCPNLSTGGHNFHAKFEYIAIEDMDKMTEVLVSLVTNA